MEIVQLNKLILPVLFLSTVFSTQAFAKKSLCMERAGSVEPKRKITHEALAREAKMLFEEMRGKFFPHLADLEIDLRFASGRDYLMRTDFELEHVFVHPRKRKYTIVFGNRYNDCYPVQEVLKPVMVHELAHIEDYSNWDSLQLLNFLVEYAFNGGYIQSYERETDMHALDQLKADPEYAIYADSLAHFRLWQYENMPEKMVLGKKRNYLSPEEIMNYGKY